MTTLLEEFFSKIKPSDEIEKVKMLCDRIKKEEEEKIFSDKFNSEHYKAYVPRGVNIFLALMTKDCNFVCLEREFKDVFIARVYKNKFLQKSYNINESKCEKILQVFAEIFKHENGE